MSANSSGTGAIETPPGAPYWLELCEYGVKGFRDIRLRPAFLKSGRPQATSYKESLMKIYHNSELKQEVQTIPP